MKWIITCTFPSGAKWAMASYKEQFALVPVENGVVRKASSWDTPEAAQDYLDAQLEVAPDLEKLGPFRIEAMELPS